MARKVRTVMYTVIVAVAALTLSSCSSGGASSSSAPGVSKDSIKIGAFYPATGNNSLYSNISAGARAYFDMVNSKGGINGKTIDYVLRDDQYDPSKTVSVARRLVEDDKVFAIVSGVGSSGNAAVLDYMTKVGIPNVAPAGGGDVFAGKLRHNYFPLYPPYSSSAKILTAYALDQLKAKSLSVFYENDDVGQPSVNAAKGVSQSAGKTLSATVGYPTSEVDFSAYAQKLKEGGADAVLAFAGTPGLTGVEKASKDIGYNPIWLAPAFAATNDFFKLGGSDGTYFDNYLVPVQTSDPSVELFKSQMKKVAPNVALGTLPEEGWVSAELFVDGVILAEANGDLTWESFIKALETFNNKDLSLGKGVTFTSQAHPGITKEGITQAKGQSFVPVATSITVPK